MTHYLAFLLINYFIMFRVCWPHNRPSSTYLISLVIYIQQRHVLSSAEIWQLATQMTSVIYMLWTVSSGGVVQDVTEIDNKVFTPWTIHPTQTIVTRSDNSIINVKSLTDVVACCPSSTSLQYHFVWPASSTDHRPYAKWLTTESKTGTCRDVWTLSLTSWVTSPLRA